MTQVHNGWIRNELFLFVLTQTLVALLTLSVLIYPGAKARAIQRSQDAARLNRLAADFYRDYDRWPKRNGGVWELATKGLIDFKSERSDYQRMYETFVWNEKSLKFVPK